MASSDSTPPLPVVLPLSSRKENVTPIGSKIAELSESRTELLTRIQGLKQDLQSWRSKLDTQVKVYRDELSELKKSLNGEVEQLRSEFQELRTTLQQQQEDVTASLRNLGLQDVSGVAPLVQETEEAEVTRGDANGEEIQAAPKDSVRRRSYFLVLHPRTELSSELAAVELKPHQSAPVDAFTSQEIDFPF